MSRRLVTGFILLAVAMCPRLVLAQGCCTPGSSPLGGITGGPTQKWSIEIGSAVDFFELDQGYEGTRKFDDPRYSTVLSTACYARIGLSRRFVAIVEIPVDNRMRRQDLATPSGPRTFEFDNTSLGDVSTLVMARVWPWSGLGPTSINAGVGMKWPTGRDDAVQDGLRVPFELQVGTGTYDPIAALSAARLFSWGSVLAVATGRLSTRADSGYRFGKSATVILQVDRALGSWSIGPQVRSRFAGVDDFNGRTVINTGGRRAMLGGQVSKEFASSGIVVQASWLGPVWQDLTGRQLGISQEFVVAVRWAVR